MTSTDSLVVMFEGDTSTTGGSASKRCNILKTYPSWMLYVIILGVWSKLGEEFPLLVNKLEEIGYNFSVAKN